MAIKRDSIIRFYNPEMKMTCFAQVWERLTDGTAFEILLHPDENEIGDRGLYDPARKNTWEMHESTLEEMVTWKNKRL